MIRPVSDVTPEIMALAETAKQEGHNNVRTLVDEFASGENRFDKSGEALLGAYQDDRLVGICGLNVDPYETAEPVARVRRLYVLPEVRRLGVATALVAQLEVLAARRFQRIQLFTASREAGRFYERLGYQPTERRKVSHEKRLP